jgi:Diguanylate cyclase, GGDEF domain
MNAPPDGAPPELLSLGTITIMIAITFFMQSGAIFFNSSMVREYKGVKTAFLATLSLSLGFAIMMLHPYLTPILMGLLSNLMMMTGHILIYIAICRFLDQIPNKYFAYGLIPLGYLVLIAAGLFPRGLPLIFITQFVGFPLDMSCAWNLHKTDNKRFSLGAYLTAVPLLIYGLITIIRIITGILSPHEVLPGPTLSNIFDVLSFYVLSYLWIAGFILMISQRLQSDLNDLAMNDALTRVRNRRAMQGLLDFEMTRVPREVKDFSIALLDIDHFKHVNDTHGHDVGDQVLHWTAQLLQASLRVQDVVARWGGEEFLILLPGYLPRRCAGDHRTGAHGHGKIHCE